MCGVTACENMQKRVSHGETVRVGSFVKVYIPQFKQKKLKFEKKYRGHNLGVLNGSYGPVCVCIDTGVIAIVCV